MTSIGQSQPACVGKDGIWRHLRKAAALDGSRPILFLYRDGVVEEVNYLHRVADIRYITGVAETVVMARRAAWRLAMVTNQAGIGRGRYGWREFAAVHGAILAMLNERSVLATPHHPAAASPYRHAAHPMRKPQPGMLLAAAQMLQGDLAKSLIVGDNVADLQAGQRAGLLRGFQVLTGQGARYRPESETLASADFAVQVIPDIGDLHLRNALTTVDDSVKEGTR
jgi:D-glycero-D-manno-heptose 1,7-bisphosphate phosphatase